jgi:hypothetical protein
MRRQLKRDEWVNLRSILGGVGVRCAEERYEACTGDAATSMARQLGCDSGLPSVKQSLCSRHDRPSRATSWFQAHGTVHVSQHEATQSKSGYARSDTKGRQWCRKDKWCEHGVGFLSAARQWLVAGLRRPRPTLALWRAAATNSTPRMWGKRVWFKGKRR